MKTMLALLLLAGCASKPRWEQGTVAGGATAKSYAYRDISGEYEVHREVRPQGMKLATRTSLNAPGEGAKLLEKTFAVSHYGSVKARGGRLPAARPELAQHTVWLEKKKYFSQLKLLPKEKKLEVVMQSPETKWQGRRLLAVPSGRVFCFFSQLPECLQMSGLLGEVAAGRAPRAAFHIVWDSYPYHQEHFSGLNPEVFASARLSLERVVQGRHQFTVEVAEQVIGLHFSKAGEFVRMFWTAQGLSVLPPGEAAQEAQL
jgi:hypothetical protein